MNWILACRLSTGKYLRNGHYTTSSFTPFYLYTLPIYILGRVALVAQRPIIVKLSRGRSVGPYVRASVGLSSALWKNGGSDPDAVWHHRSDGVQGWGRYRGLGIAHQISFRSSYRSGSFAASAPSSRSSQRICYAGEMRAIITAVVKPVGLKGELVSETKSQRWSWSTEYNVLRSIFQMMIVKEIIEIGLKSFTDFTDFQHWRDNMYGTVIMTMIIT